MKTWDTPVPDKNDFSHHGCLFAYIRYWLNEKWPGTGSFLCCRNCSHSAFLAASEVGTQISLPHLQMGKLRHGRVWSSPLLGGRVPPTSMFRLPPVVQTLSPPFKSSQCPGCIQGEPGSGSQIGPEKASIQPGPLLSLSISLMTTMPWIPVSGHIFLLLGRGSIPFHR